MRTLSSWLCRLVSTAVVAGLVLSGCTSSPASTTAGTGTPSPSQSVPVATEGSLDALLACLSAAGIPASLHDLGTDGQKVIFEPDQWVINRDLTGQVTVSYTNDTTVMTADQETVWLEPEGPLLVIDGQDHTANYTTCLSQAGYTTSETSPTTPQNPDQTNTVAEASTKWATCARKNGHLDITDPEPTSPGGLPEVVIPATITTSELAKLLKTCPPYDAAAFQKTKDAWAKGDTSYQAPAFPNLTVSPSDGTNKGEQTRIELLELINQTQAQALNQ